MVGIFYTFAMLCEMSLGIIFSLKIYPEFRRENRILKAFAGILLFLIGILHAWNAWLFYVSTAWVLIISFLVALIYWGAIKSRFLDVFLLELFYFTNIFILKMPLVTIRGLCTKRTFAQINGGQKVFVDAVYILGVVLIVGMLVYKYDILGTILKKTLLKNKLFFFCTITLEWFLFAYSIHIGQFGFSAMDLIINMMCILCTVAVMVYATLFCAYQQIRDENALQQIVNYNLKKQYTEIRKMYDANKRQVHNVKHELIYISKCLKESEYSKAHESVKKYLKEFYQIEEMFYTGFDFLDFVLNYKKDECEKKGIEFHVKVELYELGISEDDFSIVLGNLLDNAIEAAEKCINQKKYIRVDIQNVNCMLLIKVENCCAEMPLFHNGKFLSNKKDVTEHGFGIDSIRHIVEENGGELHFQYTENYFQIKILI